MADSHSGINYYYQKDYHGRGEGCSQAEVEEIVQPMNCPLLRYFAGSKRNNELSTSYNYVRCDFFKKINVIRRTRSRQNWSVSLYTIQRYDGEPIHPLAGPHHKSISKFTIQPVKTARVYKRVGENKIIFRFTVLLHSHCTAAELTNVAFDTIAMTLRVVTK